MVARTRHQVQERESQREVEENIHSQDQSDESEDEVNSPKNDPPAEGESGKEARQSVSSEEPCSFDLRNLLATNTHQINVSELYGHVAKNDREERITIPGESMTVSVNDKFLLDKASDACTQLIASLWQLTVESSDAGPLVALPPFDASRIPRSLPPPPPKQETKWEKFARERGIATNSTKKSRKVWDEAIGEWKYRHGYQKANASDKDWPIMEVKANQDPYEDPWERQREEKLKKKNKNLESRMRNEERAGALSKGITNRVVKSREKIRQAGREGGNLDRDHLPAGVPVDLRPTKTSDDVQTQKRGKLSTLAALKATQRSTASFGKFDKMLEGEPERAKIAKGKKRKLDAGKSTAATETERSMKVLRSVVEGGVEKERAKRKGQLASGETGYDYDFDDGLGPSSFKKKKGRAGAGKMKKMTKKRVK